MSIHTVSHEWKAYNLTYIPHHTSEYDIKLRRGAGWLAWNCDTHYTFANEVKFVKWNLTHTIAEEMEKTKTKVGAEAEDEGEANIQMLIIKW